MFIDVVEEVVLMIRKIQGAIPISENKTASKTADSLALAVAAAKTAEDNNATDIVILDMTGVSALFDYFVIATGSSQRQLNAIADEIEVFLKRQMNERRLSDHTVDRTSWIVLDYGSVVVHLFDEDTRAFYSLEALWADSPRVEWKENSK
ncbi:MAG: ribosome silencing factor [Pirellulaceae bacterium]